MDAFEALLLRPQHYIFNREWYERLAGHAEFEEYRREFGKLSRSQRTELLQLLSSCDPRHIKNLSGLTTDPQIRRILPYYTPLTKEREAEIWALQKALARADEPRVPEDERVEDAGLAESIHLNSKKSLVTAGAAQ